MDKPPGHRTGRPPPREERLAAKLRENLHRRKAQARAVAGTAAERGENNESGALSKSDPES
jgi:hypothetical protein